jgi:type IV pilus assembly protein PilB
VAGQRRWRLGEILVASGVLTPAQLEQALARQRLGTTVVGMRLSTEEDIAAALAQQLGLETVDLVEVGPDPAAVRRVPRTLAERHEVLPLHVDGRGHLVVAMSDPTDVVAMDDLKLTSGLAGVRAVVSTGTAVTAALRRAYGSDEAALDMFAPSPDETSTAAEDTEDVSTVSDGDEPIIRLVNALLTDAVASRTSDVHVEPERDHVRVRFRIDGLLREKMRVPRHIGPALVSRLKIMSSLDIAERRRPQDGRAMIRVEGQDVDVRVSTMPTMFGETIVLRLLHKQAEKLRLGDLGMATDVREQLETALTRPQGLILLTGPTGSGKTTTLYAALSQLSEPTRNVLTLEDPIEYHLEGINQTQVNPRIDLTFARGLRTILRQDPDVVMVGEIRDRETAELAMEASFTGHLVLSTLHTNDAPSTILRLADLGVDRFLIGSSLLLVAGQRLCRNVCPQCREPATPDESVLHRLGLAREDLDGARLVAGAGCQVCERTGYLGRTALLEMLQVTTEMRELITGGGTETAIGRLARRQGMRSLRLDGIVKAMAGITTLDEVLRVTPDEPLGEDDAEGAQAAARVTPRLVQRLTGGDGATATPGPEDHAVRPPTILVVDDDASVRELLRVVLADDYRTVDAADGAAAVAMFDEHRPDLVLLDLKLPDVDGITVAKRIRALEHDRDVPILVVTGVEDAATEVDGLLAGVDDYVRKPFNDEVLLARITAALRRVA